MLKIDAAKFETAITSSGLRAEQKASRITVYGPEGRAIGVGKGKTVTAVWLVGFECEHGEAAGKRETGTVKQYMNMEGTEDEVLARFAALLALLPTLEPVVKAKREAKPKADAPKGFSDAIPAAPKADRKALIEKVAREKGVKVSAKTKAEIDGTSNGVAQQ